MVEFGLWLSCRHATDQIDVQLHRPIYAHTYVRRRLCRPPLACAHHNADLSNNGPHPRHYQPNQLAVPPGVPCPTCDHGPVGNSRRVDLYRQRGCNSGCCCCRLARGQCRSRSSTRISAAGIRANPSCERLHGDEDHRRCRWASGRCRPECSNHDSRSGLRSGRDRDARHFPRLVRSNGERQ
ncbi:hypothetical protein D9M71_559560 [compost metagenome]